MSAHHPVPYIQECLCVDYCMTIVHEADAFPNMPKSSISTLTCASVDCANPLIILHHIAGKTGLSAFCMVVSMELVNEKAGVHKIASLTDKGVGCELAGKIIDYDFRSMLKSCIYRREDVVAAFSNRDCVEAKAD